MIYKPFSVIVVPFPFTDSKQVKMRPALVISQEVFQTENEHVSLLMITSALHKHWYGDHQIIDLNVTGLKSDSLIRQKIFTIDNRLIRAVIGKLSKQDQNKVLENMALSLAKN